MVIDPWTSSATLDCSLLNGLLHASHDTDEPGEAELPGRPTVPMAEERWDDAMHYYQLSAEEGCAEGLAMMGEMLYEGRGCRKSPAQARKFWKKAADAGDVAAWVALGDDAMVQGKRGRRGSAGLPQGSETLCLHPRHRLYGRRSACGWPSMRPSISPAKRRWLSWLRRSRASSSAKKRATRRPRVGWDETEAVIRQLLERE